MKIAKINCTNPNCNVNTKANSYKTPDVLGTVTARLKNPNADSFTKMDRIAENILNHKKISKAESEEFFRQPKFKQDEHLLFAKFMKK